jgi:hypothetical protein
LWLYAGNGASGFLNNHGTDLGTSWTTYDTLFSPGDFTGDGHSDVIGRKPDGTLWLYRGSGTGTWAAGKPVQIGTSFDTFNLMFSPGDFTGDAHPDVICRKPDGTLMLYRGNGAGTWAPGKPVQIGTGWQGFTTIF